MMICPACATGMGDGARFCSGCGRPVAAPMYTTQRYGTLERPRHGRVIAGVCAGFAQRYGWDPILVRLVLCAVVVLGCGTPLIAYVIAWIVMPNGQYVLPQTTGGVSS